MIAIPYPAVMAAITLLWLIRMAVSWKKQGKFPWKRELELLFVYICIVVVVRFTFFPFSKVNGAVQPLNFAPAQVWPFRVNFTPLVHLLDYPVFREAMINVIGNTAMFIPLGIVWPAVLRKLDTHGKAIAAGVLTSLAIEIAQLPFFERASDIDDLLLNSLGYLLGYGIFLLFQKIKKRSKV